MNPAVSVVAVRPVRAAQRIVTAIAVLVFIQTLNRTEILATAILVNAVAFYFICPRVDSAFAVVAIRSPGTQVLIVGVIVVLVHIDAENRAQILSVAILIYLIALDFLRPRKNAAFAVVAVGSTLAVVGQAEVTVLVIVPAINAVLPVEAVAILVDSIAIDFIGIRMNISVFIVAVVSLRTVLRVIGVVGILVQIFANRAVILAVAVLIYPVTRYLVGSRIGVPVGVVAIVSLGTKARPPVIPVIIQVQAL